MSDEASRLSVTLLVREGSARPRCCAPIGQWRNTFDPGFMTPDVDGPIVEPREAVRHGSVERIFRL